MDPNRPGPTPDPHEVVSPDQVSAQATIPLEKQMFDTIEKALAIQRRFEPGKEVIFDDKLLSATEEFTKNLPFQEEYTSYTEDKLLAAHHTDKREVVIFDFENLTETLRFTTTFDIVQKCFSPGNDYLLILGHQVIEVRKVATGDKLWQTAYSNIPGFDRISFGEKRTNSERLVVKSTDP